MNTAARTHGEGAPEGQTLRLAGIAYLAGAPQFIGNVVPVLLGAIAERFQASPLQLGTINSCYTALSLAAAATAPWWVRRLPWRGTALLAALGICALFALAGRAGSIPALYLLFALAGAFAGLMGGPANARIGLTATPARWWSVSMVFQMIVAAVFSVAVTWILQPRFGPLVALTGMAVMFLPCVIAALGLRRPVPAATAAQFAAQPLARAGPVTQTGVSRPLAAAFAGSTLFALGGVAYWIFLERMAHGAAVSSGFVGVAIAVGTVAAAASAALAATLARHLRLLIVLGSAAGVAGYAAMLRPSAAIVLASACLFNVAWGILVPAYQAIIRRADAASRYFVAGPATIFLAGVAAGPVAGSVAQAYGYDAVMILSICVTALGLLLALYAHQATPSAQTQRPEFAGPAH